MIIRIVVSLNRTHVQSLSQRTFTLSSAWHATAGEGTILHVYRQRLADVLKQDGCQLEMIGHLQRLDDQLRNYRPPPQHASSSLVSKLSRFFATTLSVNNETKVKGLYLWGGVGVGKTMIMDLFYDNCAVSPIDKRRVHFHQFMLNFHARLHEMKTSQRSGNLIAAVAEEIVAEAWLLCLDEFQVTDIGDAMMVRLAFGELFARGLVLVATSNRSPDELYKKGLQRAKFLPFVSLLKRYTDVVQLQSTIDYRRLTEKVEEGGHKSYFVKAADTNEQLNIIFDQLAKHENDIVHDRKLNVNGRTITLLRTCGRILDATFDQLCGNPLGAADYLKLATTFDTIIIRDVPRMSTLACRNEVRRLITMIDTFYDQRVRLIMSAEATPDELFVSVERKNNEDGELADNLGISIESGISLFTGEEEIFALDRTLSRLIEMQTITYWNSAKSFRE